MSADRFLVKFTASRALRDKLELACDLMRHANPDGELSVVLERAVRGVQRVVELTPTQAHRKDIEKRTTRPREEAPA